MSNTRKSTDDTRERPRDVISGLPVGSGIQHGIEFGEFNSHFCNLLLHERIAPTPAEKEVVASIPYMQGVVDMSAALGHRVYENREITYVFYRFAVPQEDAGVIQSTITNLVMRGFDQRLDDSFDPLHHYYGKCREVLVEDDYPHQRFRVTMTFDLYPFKIRNDPESTDDFDRFNFDLDVFHASRESDLLRVELAPVLAATPEEERKQTITLYNNGKRTVGPTITASVAGVEVTLSNKEPYVTEADPERVIREMVDNVEVARWYVQDFPGFRLRPGANIVTVENKSGAAAVITFDWRKELL